MDKQMDGWMDEWSSLDLQHVAKDRPKSGNTLPVIPLKMLYWNLSCNGRNPSE